MYNQYWVYFPSSRRVGKVELRDLDLLVGRFPQYIYFEALAKDVER